MPSYLDFDTTKNFRNIILGKTLTVPNGPQTFTSNNYLEQRLSDMSNIDPGAVDTNRSIDLLQPATSNVFKPMEFFVNENLNTIPRKANLQLYPYFETTQSHSFISIMTTSNYEHESELMKFAAWNIKKNTEGPFFARMRQNLYTTTSGKVRLLDALEGNLSTATNILTGREPLVEMNTKITVAKTVAGKGVDFLQTVMGLEFPWTEIPGDYLTDPQHQTINRPASRTESGKIIQDITGVLGSLIGIQRRPLPSRKPSDLLIEYMGERQKSFLFDNIGYSKYAPDYTTTARSQNTSKIFNFVDQFAESVKNTLGIEAPRKNSYIGDDRSDNVLDAMNDFNQRPVKSNYYLSLMFDPIQTTLFERKRNISEGGGIGGKLTWISTKSKNKLGVHNEEYASEQSQLKGTLSTKYAFREDSILGLTQQILETLPTDGGASRTHVANVIDQTSRVFREGKVMMSRGSAIKYVNKFTGTESGIEYCRVWTKDRSYMNYSDTMKKQTKLSRKFESSVFSGAWNLNIYPNSNGNGAFDSGSTNMAKGKGDGFYAKKYMFSFENLAWKSSNTPGFTYNDLPYCERGPNYGRIMWFPPYDLKVTEQNSANWESNSFLGRPEPVYTYKDTQRSGTISFKVIVDHPSILNLLVKDHFKNMSDEESDNYINAFFAGCKEVDFYAMIRNYATLDESDVRKIRSYLDGNKDPNVIKKYKTVIEPLSDPVPVPKNDIKISGFGTALNFQNDYPGLKSTAVYTSDEYEILYDSYIAYKTTYINLLNDGLYKLELPGWTNDQRLDYYSLTNIDTKERPLIDEFTELRARTNEKIVIAFQQLQERYEQFKTDLATLKSGIDKGNIKNIRVKMGSSTSQVADNHYNLDLSYRRSDSVIRDIIKKIAKSPDFAQTVINSFSWAGPKSKTAVESTETGIVIKLSDLGYDKIPDGEFIIEYVGNVGEQPPTTLPSGTSTLDCTDKYKVVLTELKKTTPRTFGCRETNVRVSYETKQPDEPLPDPIPPKVHLIEETDTVSGVPTTPPLDEMKRIIMKTLSECYYFKKLEEESPVQFSSLREKLRYFHPAFHSMTPEGLNARLTFLNQCLRPGETLPIKGTSDISDLNARNTTFGPPPICVMRIGDFYHSKIAIKDVNIEFEDNLWDLNPEGIGVQPMIANVTLQVHFIGGHGLTKPVERLQNALSSNFYANTEIYDPRSISTETSIDGKDVKTFTKEFLKGLVKKNSEKKNPTSQEPVSTEKKISQGTFIGTMISSSTDSLVYSDLVGTVSTKDSLNNIFSATRDYFNTFDSGYNSLMIKYDSKIASMFLSPTYRSIKDYVVQTGTGTETIELLGEYKKNGELPILVSNFRSKILDKINNENMTTIIGFNKDMTTTVQVASERLLKPFVIKTVNTVLDGILQTTETKNIEEKRNVLIKLLDGLNFVLETGMDGKVNKEEYIGVVLSGYTSDMLYSLYSDNIDLIQNDHHKFTDDLDETYVFSRNTTMTTNDLSYFLSVFLKNYKAEILNLYKPDTKVFTDRIILDMSKRFDKFASTVPDYTKFKFKFKFPLPKNDERIMFDIGSESDVFSNTEKQNLKLVHNTSRNITTSVLNYYR